MRPRRRFSMKASGTGDPGAKTWRRLPGGTQPDPRSRDPQNQTLRRRLARRTQSTSDDTADRPTHEGRAPLSLPDSMPLSETTGPYRSGPNPRSRRRSIAPAAGSNFSHYPVINAWNAARDVCRVGFCEKADANTWFSAHHAPSDRRAHDSSYSSPGSTDTLTSETHPSLANRWRLIQAGIRLDGSSSRASSAK